MKRLAGRASVGSQGSSSPPPAVQGKDPTEQRRRGAMQGTQAPTAAPAVMLGRGGEGGFIGARFSPGRSSSVKNEGRGKKAFLFKPANNK